MSDRDVDFLDDDDGPDDDGPGGGRAGGGGGPVDASDAEAILRRVADIVATARPMPLSASVLVNKDELLELLDHALDQFPEELRQARWMLKERDEFLAKTRQEAEDILAEARVAAGRMVERTEIVREARSTARRVVDEADAEARRLRHEAEDYCDQKLAAFEVVLDRTIKTVQAGREKLQVAPLPPPERGEGLFGEGGEADEAGAGEGFFDQDHG